MIVSTSHLEIGKSGLCCKILKLSFNRVSITTLRSRNVHMRKGCWTTDSVTDGFMFLTKWKVSFLFLRSRFSKANTFSVCGVVHGFIGVKVPQTAIQQNKYLPQSFSEISVYYYRLFAPPIWFALFFYWHEFAFACCLPIATAECIVAFNLEFYSHGETRAAQSMVHTLNRILGNKLS